MITRHFYLKRYVGTIYVVLCVNTDAAMSVKVGRETLIIIYSTCRRNFFSCTTDEGSKIF